MSSPDGPFSGSNAEGAVAHQPAGASWPIGFLLAEPAYARLWLATLLSNLSAHLARGAVYVWVAGQWNSTTVVANLVAAEGAAALLIAPFVGRIVDRSPRRAIMQSGDLIRAALLLGAIPFFGLPAACLVLFVLAGAGVLHQSARDAALCDVIAYARIPRASGLDQIAGHLAIGVGPFLGTMLALHAGISIALAVAALGHVLGAIVASGLPFLSAPLHIDKHAAEPPHRIRVAPHLPLQALTFFAFGVLSAGLWLASAPELLSRLTSRSAELYGFHLAATGITALLGSLVAPAAIERWGSLRVLGFAGCVEAGAMLLYALAPDTIAMSLAVMVLGAAAAGVSTAFYAHLQQTIAAAVRGRVFAIVRQLDAGGLLAAGLIARAVGHEAAPEAIIGGGAICYLVLALSVLRITLRSRTVDAR